MILSIYVLAGMCYLPLSSSFMMPVHQSKGHLCLPKNTHTLAAQRYPSLEDNVQVGGRDIISHVALVDESLRKLSGEGIFERMGLSIAHEANDIYEKICENERFVLITHGIESDPIYNYGNVAALEAFARTWDDLRTIPSRESVVIRSQDEKLRIELMKTVTDTGFVDGATGIRVRGDDKFIRLVDAVVWNCYDRESVYVGQAALFDRDKAEILTSTK